MARGAAALALDDDRKGLGSWPANVPATGFSTACPPGKDPRAPIRMAAIRDSAGENVPKSEPMCATGGNEQWCSCCGKQSACMSPAIPLLCTYPGEKAVNVCIPVFTAALLTTAKMGKQPKCPGMNE